jgi:hypothetical protein
MRTLTATALLALLGALSGCIQQEEIDPMVKQAKYKAYAPNPFFADGRAMRVPPGGTVPRERRLGSSALIHGLDDKGQPITGFPLPLTPELLKTGQKKFNIHCAICHGIAGDGQSLVASQMSLKAPPSLHERRNLTDGHLYEVVANGYGLMAGYGVELTIEERWAVVAYVRALQRSQDARLEDAPAEVRAHLSAAPAAPAHEPEHKEGK